MKTFRMSITVSMVMVLWMVSLPASSAAGDSIDSLGWMCGTWEGFAESLESWMAPRDGLMLGVNRTLRVGKTPFFEFLRIEERPDGIVFVAMLATATASRASRKCLRPGGCVAGLEAVREDEAGDELEEARLAPRAVARGVLPLDSP